MIPHLGRVLFSCRIYSFFITNREVKSPPILSLKSSVKSGLIKKVDVDVDAVTANMSSKNL